MAQPNYDSIIDKLSEDPEFLDLSQDEQDQLVHELAQEKMGVVPKTENFLQRAIKNSRIGTFGGTSITAALPSDGEEFRDMGKVAMRQAIPDQSGLVGVGANMAGVKGNIGLPSPQTPYGQNLESSANIAQLSHMVGGIGSLLKQPIGNAINSLRTSPIKNEIKSIEDLIAHSKKAEIPVKEDIANLKLEGRNLGQKSSREAERVAYEGSKAIKGQVSARFKDANQRFGEEFSKLESTMGDEDLGKVIKNAAYDIGAADVPGTPGSAMLSQLGRFGPKNNPEVIQTVPRIYNKEQLQAITKEILDSLPDDRSKAVFHKHLLDALDESVPGLRELKRSHAPIYQVAKESKSLTKGAIKRVARGTASEPEVDTLRRAGEKLGTSHVERAKRVSDKNTLEKMMLEQRSSINDRRLAAKGEEQSFLKDKIPGLERKIQDVRFRQAAAGGVASLLGAGGILSKLFSVDRSK